MILFNVFKTPRFWLSLISLGIVLALLYKDLGQISPGPLSLSHARVDGLEGRFSCDSCHGDTPDDLAQSCGECHSEILDSMEAGTGLHGTLNVLAAGIDQAATSARRCGTCHSEHHGRQFELTGDFSFELAGFASKEDFSHDRMEYALAGRHSELACMECHALADAPSLLEGESRFGEQSSACASCHEDPHEGQITWACADCHGQDLPFEQLDGFVHTLAFELSGAHELGEERCVACHEPDSSESVESLANDNRQTPDRGCAACHESPHAQDFLEATAQELELTGDNSCSACHTTEQGGYHGGDAPMGSLVRAPLSVASSVDTRQLERTLHAATGFPLDLPHSEVLCAACHTGAAETFASRYPGRAATDCVACHEDPHEASNGPSCTDCHQATGPWNDLSLFNHADDFPLTGVHGQLACASCHDDTSDFSVPALSARREASLGIAQRTCAACHDDPHSTSFVAGVGELLARPNDDTCSSCHSLDAAPALRGGEGFATQTMPEALHGASGFVLDPSHTDVACIACHAGDSCRVPIRGTGIHAGEVIAKASFELRFQKPGARDDCRACHDDPHGDEFEASMLVSGAEQCGVCHEPERFSPSIVDVKLHASARLPLDGAHAAVACFSCHTAAEDLPTATPRFLDASTSCADCHTDIHEGKLASVPADLNGEVGCARCHTSADFGQVALVDAGLFEHGPWCGFELEGAHQSADCAACHRPEQGRDFGRVSSSFDGPPSECATCHVDVHQGSFSTIQMPLEFEGERGCARCHTPLSFTGTFRGSLAQVTPDTRVFDHGLWSDYALEGPHAAAACSSCHAPTGTTNLGPARGTSCSDCHVDIHLGQLRAKPSDKSTDCSTCHSVPSEASKIAFVADLFDHAVDSTFPLDEIHAPLECAACHKSWPLENGGNVVRYKPLGSICTDCHGMPSTGGKD